MLLFANIESTFLTFICLNRGDSSKKIYRALSFSWWGLYLKGFLCLPTASGIKLSWSPPPPRVYKVLQSVINCWFLVKCCLQKTSCEKTGSLPPLCHASAIQCGVMLADPPPPLLWAWRFLWMAPKRYLI